MFCANCGKQAEEGTKFCADCGAPLETAPAPVTPEPEVVPVVPVAEFEGQSSVTGAPEKVEPVATPVEPVTPPVTPVAPPQAGFTPPPAPPAGKQSPTVSTATFFWLDLVMAIPLAGLIVCIVLACGVTSKKSLENWAKAKLIWTLIGFILLLVLVILVVVGFARNSMLMTELWGMLP